jgi:hypothetical protein
MHHHSTRVLSTNHNSLLPCLSRRLYEPRRCAHSIPGHVHHARDPSHGHRTLVGLHLHQREDGSTPQEIHGRATCRGWTRCMRDISRRTGQLRMSLYNNDRDVSLIQCSNYVFSVIVGFVAITYGSVPMYKMVRPPPFTYQCLPLIPILDLPTNRLGRSTH